MSALLPVYDRDLVIVSGKGARVTDDQGRTYLDFAAGVGVNGLGYGDRKVLSAIRKQAGRMIHASNLYHNAPATALAERLVALAFPAKVFFCNSGTEAVEGAIKFARRIGREQGRTELVAFERSFHGRTLGALSMTWTAKYRDTILAQGGTKDAAVLVKEFLGREFNFKAFEDYLTKDSL